jgi:RNA-directed DNA polymerase
MQSKLATWSTEDKERKFDRLLRLIAQKQWLHEAAMVTLRSNGAKTPGIDEVSKQDIMKDLDEYLSQIRLELLAGNYQPKPAKRIFIPKAQGKQRPLGIPCLKDRIVQRAMLMVMEPIWESDFHNLSYGFRPNRSVHHAIRTLKLQLQDNKLAKAGRWIIEGDLASYFDMVHHKILMKTVRKRIRDKRFLTLLWRFLKAGCIDNRMFKAAHEGVPQGGVLSPLLSNIMLNEFDQWLDKRYIGKKARKDRWYWNNTIRKKRPIALKERRQWKPAVSYCRFADDFTIVVKGTKQQTEEIRKECQQFLEKELKLKLNMDKTVITHVDDGFIFLGQRIIRKRGPLGTQRVVTGIPHEKLKAFIGKLSKKLSSNYDSDKCEMIAELNQQITGWGYFYRHTDYTAKSYAKVDRVVFWKFAHFLARKYKTSIKQQMKRWYKYSPNKKRKTWCVKGLNRHGRYIEIAMKSLADIPKQRFRKRMPKRNSYITMANKVSRFRYQEVAMAMSRS